MKIYVDKYDNTTPFEESIYCALPLSKAQSACLTGLPPEVQNFCLFCENAEDNISGLCNAGKLFLKYDYPLTEEYINSTLREYDVMLPMSQPVKAASLDKLLSADMNCAELVRSCRSLIEESYPQYVKAFSYVLNHNLLTPELMLISKSDIIKDIRMFIINILTELKSVLPGSPEPVALLCLILLRTFFAAGNHKIREEICANDSLTKHHANNESTRLTYNYYRILLNNLLEYRKANGMSNPLADPFECKDDFEGKIPVFICWWQGADDLPEIVRACIGSIRKNLPQDKVCVRIITLDNCGEYVTFTDDIINKFNDGKISYTHLAEALRAELIYRYGGLWIDATYYIPEPIPADFFDNNEFYTLSFRQPLFGPDISLARWATSLWYAREKHNPMMQMLLEEIWVHWETEEQVLNYFIMDYLTACAYNEIPKARAMIDNCLKADKAGFDFQLRLSQQYTAKEQVKLAAELPFCKINRRYEYKNATSLGYPTVYGHMLSELRGECTAADKGKILQQRTEQLSFMHTDSINDLIGIIREINAVNVLDLGMYFMDKGCISRMMLNDVILSEMIIDGYSFSDTEANSIPAIAEGFYNSYKVISPDAIAELPIISQSYDSNLMKDAAYINNMTHPTVDSVYGYDAVIINSEDKDIISSVKSKYNGKVRYIIEITGLVE